MKMKNISLAFLILVSSSVAQDFADLNRHIDIEKYISRLTQRLQLNQDKSLDQIVNYLNHNEINLSGRQQSGLWLIDNYTFQKWNSSSWQNDSGQVYDYNQNNLISEKRIRDWVGTQWVDQSRFLYNYNQSQRLESRIFQVYLSNSWFDSTKKSYDYNNEGLLSAETTYRWNNSNWENWQLLTATYNLYNEPLQDVYQIWDINSWVNTDRTVYEYSVNSITIRFDIWLFETWINLLRIIANYDTNGILSEIKIQIWLFGWENLIRTLYTIDNNLNIIEALNQEWDFDISEWVNYSRITSTYTPENLPETSLEKIWSANSYWVNYFFRTFNYDEFLNHKETIGQSWNGSWSNSEREVFGYIDVTSVEETKLYTNEFKLNGNYPNPFNPTTTINFHVPELSNVTLKVYNSIGEEVSVLLNKELLPGDYNIKWNAQGFNSGVYFYQIKANEFVKIKKMILLK